MGEPRDAGKYPFSCEIKRPLEQSKYLSARPAAAAPPPAFFFFLLVAGTAARQVFCHGGRFSQTLNYVVTAQRALPLRTPSFHRPRGGQWRKRSSICRLLEFSAERSWWEVRGNLCLKPAPRLARGLDRPFFRPLRKPRVWSERVATRPAPENVPGSVSASPKPQAGRVRLF